MNFFNRLTAQKPGERIPFSRVPNGHMFYYANDQWRKTPVGKGAISKLDGGFYVFNPNETVQYIGPSDGSF